MIYLLISLHHLSHAHSVVNKAVLNKCTVDTCFISQNGLNSNKLVFVDRVACQQKYLYQHFVVFSVLLYFLKTCYEH